MKTLFEEESKQEILRRIDLLTPLTQRQWGKMDVAQMLAHCSKTMEVATGKKNIKRSFLGWVIGPLFKTRFLNEKPFTKSSPTDQSFIIADERNFEKEKEQLKELIVEFHNGGEEKCTDQAHTFFGKLTKKEWARGMYKHLDHHFQQFGV